MSEKLIVLGATGSIGASALDVVRDLAPRFQIVGLACHARWQDLATIESLTKLWLETPFEGGRHAKRVAKIEG